MLMSTHLHLSVNTWAVYEQTWKQMKKDDLAETSVLSLISALG